MSRPTAIRSFGSPGEGGEGGIGLLPQMKFIQQNSFTQGATPTLTNSNESRVGCPRLAPNVSCESARHGNCPPGMRPDLAAVAWRLRGPASPVRRAQRLSGLIIRAPATL